MKKFLNFIGAFCLSITGLLTTIACSEPEIKPYDLSNLNPNLGTIGVEDESFISDALIIKAINNANSNHYVTQESVVISNKTTTSATISASEENNVFKGKIDVTYKLDETLKFELAGIIINNNNNNNSIKVKKIIQLQLQYQIMRI